MFYLIITLFNYTAYVNILLNKIKIVYLPPKTTAFLQPCEQGIIRTLKVYYCQEMVSRILLDTEENQGITANELAKKTRYPFWCLHCLAVPVYGSSSENTIIYCFKGGRFIRKD